MFLSLHHRRPRQLVGWSFAGLLAIFVAIATLRPEVGLAGAGAVLVLMAVLVEIQSDSIWKEYKHSYKPTKNKLLNELSVPKEGYYKANVYFVWPVVFVVGIVSIYVAYLLS
jgi:hypothetical protein